MTAAPERSVSMAVRAGFGCFVAMTALERTPAEETPAPAAAVPQDSTAEVDFFESRVRPVLVRHCYECHSAASGKAEGSLQLDSRDGIRAGGDRGPAVVPGDPAASLLLEAVSHTDPDFQMPPKRERLPASVLADLRRWIEGGAIDPREAATTAAAGPPVTIEEGRKFWAYRKPQPQVPPSTGDPAWAKQDLDRFILAKLEKSGLKPSRDAEPGALLRRLHFDLVGLPPTPDAIRAFLDRIETRGLDAALEAEVDTLLASPAFGERWGRHWLDVARFAESSGKEANISFPYAWRYRDYVIDAVNDDVPFDRFITEQIAGDLLPCDSDAERARLLIATGFLAVGPKNLDEGNLIQFTADTIDEQIDAVTRAVTATSVACARCHDHKFDPFTMEDYYALAGVFASTKTWFGTHVSPANRTAGDPLVLPPGAGAPILHASIKPERVTELKTKLAELKSETPKTLTDALRIFWTSGGIEGELERVDEAGQALPLAMGATEAGKAIDAPLLERGEIAKPRQPVPRGFPQVVELPDIPSIPPDRSGRLEFAQWLTHADHPLTARVMANRVWRHLLGAGIVQTTDNFGFGGERPSHPELLDHLAVRFMEGGWSVKRFVRGIVLSRTYRQASDYDDAKFRVDPENRLVWRASKRRLEAEAIRDAMLAASGELDFARPVGSLVAHTIGDRPISLIGLDSRLPGDLDGSKHRSVYLPVLRDRLPDILDLFDFAEPSLVTGDRETTNVPVQALYLMNSPFVQERASALANRLIREADTDPDRVERAFLLCLGRSPDDVEARLAGEFLAQADGENQRPNLAAFCHALVSTAEFRNLD